MNTNERERRGKELFEAGAAICHGVYYRVADNDMQYTIFRGKDGRIFCTCANQKEKSKQDPLYRCEHIYAVKYAALARQQP
ncbi:MAG TPA: hypothetical protein VEF04_04680 [Blastocatellia bacterium]|nr:hypothetical protein [Blastocatellia bacterium]